ncbi:MAG: ATP-binding protein [Candidatus Eisenbacteria bacterium]|nr:ATP-binding protein [Candidatus Eisenbacteria bacterium]
MPASSEKTGPGARGEEIAVLSIPGRLEYLPFADALLVGVAASLGMGDDEKDAFSISILEAGTNAIQHGSKYDESKKIVFSFIVEDGSLSVLVKDEGPGFELDKVLLESKPDDWTRPRGRGIFIMKSLMGTVDFAFGKDRGTTVLLSQPRPSGHS